MTPHESNVIQAFKDTCAKNAGEAEKGASPFEVTLLLRERDQMPELDTVIDVERTMRSLRNRGLL